MNQFKIYIFFLLNTYTLLTYSSLINGDNPSLGKKIIVNWVNKNLTPRLQGQRQTDFILRKSKLPLYFAPNRKASIDESLFYKEGLHPLKKKECPFDFFEKFKLPYFEFKSKSFYLYPNIMPYGKNHLLVIPKKEKNQKNHFTQDSLEYFLNDILDIKDHFSSSTLFFNHFAGNTLEHLHVHLVDNETYLLNDYRIMEKDNQIKLSPNISWYQYSPCLKGFFIQAHTKEKFEKQLKDMINKIKKSHLLYNMVIFPKGKDRDYGFLYSGILIPRISTSPIKKIPHQDFLSKKGIFSSLSSYDLIAGKVLYTIPDDLFDYLKIIDTFLVHLCEETILQDFKCLIY